MRTYETTLEAKLWVSALLYKLQRDSDYSWNIEYDIIHPATSLDVSYLDVSQPDLHRHPVAASPFSPP